MTAQKTKSGMHLKSKKKIKEHRKTLKELHENTMNDIEENNKQELKQLKSKLNKLENQNGKFQQIKKIKTRIHAIENNDDLSNYLLQIRDILVEKCKDNSVNHEEYNVKLIQTKTQDQGQGQGQGQEQNQDQQVQQTKNGFFVQDDENTSSTQKGTLVEKYYLSLSHYINIDDMQNIKNPSIIFVNEMYCEKCNGYLIRNRNEGTKVCEKCGISQVFQDPMEAQWSDTCHIQNKYRYKRLFYFIDHLNRFQAKENANIPPIIIQKIMVELNKRRINSLEQIKPSLIRSILKELKHTEYYDHINTIILKISKKEPPVISDELQKRLIIMFTRTLKPFEKYKHLIPNRNNYLSYPYVVRKLLQIIAEWDQNEQLKSYISHFQLLKSKEKLQLQEVVWKEICKETGFPFFKSI